MEKRAGVFIKEPSGYRVFVPKPLPPIPPIIMDEDLSLLLSKADRHLGRLDGVIHILPNPDFFVGMYVNKEAVLSSQIEGTQASLIDILGVEESPTENKEIHEVINYVGAMNHGLQRLNHLPPSLRLIREIHGELIKDTRGGERSPGEFRKTQNWIGPAGSTLDTAVFIPPSPPEMKKAIGDLEKFMHAEDKLPPLIKIGLIHAQFETIHPFLDGNGRMGRLLITFWLCQQKILSKPLLYLSLFLKKNRIEYYDRLMEIRLKGDWEGWLKFFLRGIAEVSAEAYETAKSIMDIKEKHSVIIRSSMRNSLNGLRLHEILFKHPLITVKKGGRIIRCITTNRL